MKGCRVIGGEVGCVKTNVVVFELQVIGMTMAKAKPEQKSHINLETLRARGRAVQ